MSAKYTEEKLLNTAEAARFLRVSQASVRRWFDAGLLPGHRVGRRRERRFRESDLLAFIEHPARTAPDAPTINLAGVRAGLPVHLAAFYGSDSGRFRLSIPFLAEGLRLGQPAFLVTSGAVLDAYQHKLDLREVTVVGEFDGQTSKEVIHQFERLFARALAGGGTAIRMVGEKATVRPWFISEAESLDFEDDFEVMSKRYPVAVLCQYDVREFSGVALLRALKAHPDMYELRTGAFLN